MTVRIVFEEVLGKLRRPGLEGIKDAKTGGGGPIKGGPITVNTTIGRKTSNLHGH